MLRRRIVRPGEAAHDQAHAAAINIGRRPTFYEESGLLLVEAGMHRHAVDVLPIEGTYRRGYADIDVNVQIFPGGGGGDISAEDIIPVF